MYNKYKYKLVKINIKLFLKQIVTLNTDIIY